MNKFTKRELEKVQNILNQPWDDTTSHIVVSRDGVISQSLGFKPGDKFTIQVAEYIINQPPNFTLAENWNQGTYPPEYILDVEVVRTMGQMTGVRAVGVETGKTWEGWLPNKGFRIL